MMYRILLFILDRLGFVYSFMGVDYHQVRAIVATKLLMDERRPMLSMGQQSNNRGYYYALFIYFIFGLLVSMLIYAVPSVLVSMTIIFSYIMVMVIMILITDFSSVLLDTSDNSIILPRPITSKTLLAARITHIVLYISMLVLSLSLGSLVAVFIKFNVYGIIAFIVGLLLSVLLAVTLTNGLYLLIMRFTTEERLKNAINYLQIGMTILFMGGYQLLPRLIGTADKIETNITFYWWTYLIPPIWFSAAIEAFQTSVFDLQHMTLSLLAISFPILGVFYVSKYLAPVFTEKIQDMGIESRSTKATPETNKSWMSAFGKLITIPGPERAGYMLTAKSIGRDRKLKLKLYPAIGYFIVLAVILLFRFNDEGNILESLRAGKSYILLIYFSSFILYTAFFEISYTENFKSSWVYFSSPIEAPGYILTGSLKALLVSLFAPIYLGISIFSWFIWGVEVTDDLVFGLINNLVIVLSIAIINKKFLPQSLPDGARASASSFARGITMMLMMLLLGLLHYGALQISWALWILTPLLGLIAYYMLKSYRSLSWKELQTS